MDAREDPLIGQEIANFRLERVIGFGAMGRVYAAVHPVMGRKAAIKVLDPNLAETTEVVDRFLNEARAVNEIRHPNIVEVTDCGTHAGHHYLVMELLDGETLSDCLQQSGALDPAQAVHIGAQIAAALHAAHQRGVVHRDLKPDNIFLIDHDGLPDFVKVLDFGVAKILRPEMDVRERRTEVGTLIGTPHYMSPEQCLGEQDVGAPSDIYSLGVLIYEMLAGELPFEADNLGQLLLAHVNQVPTDVAEAAPGTPEHIARVVMSALAKDVADRPESMLRFRGALRGEPEREVTQAMPAVVAPPSARPAPDVPEKKVRDRRGTARTIAARSEDLPKPRPANHQAQAPSAAEARKPASRPAGKKRGTGRSPGDQCFGLSQDDSQRPKRVATKLGRIILEKVSSNNLVLPTMPQVAIECMQVINRPMADFSEIAGSLERDPLLAGQVLRVANSVAFMSAEKARTVAQAIARLGGRQLRTLLIELSAHRVFQSRDAQIRAAFKGIWEHSLAVAVLSRRLCERAGRGIDPELCHLAGLLHDVGKPMVGSLLLEAEKRLEATDRAFMSPELWMSVVDDCHRQVGVSVAEAWKMPPELVDAIAHADRFDPDTAHSVRNYVCLANALAKREGFQIGEGDAQSIDDTVDAGLQLMDLDAGALTEVSESLETQVRGRRPSAAPRAASSG